MEPATNIDLSEIGESCFITVFKISYYGQFIQDMYFKVSSLVEKLMLSYGG